MGELPQVPISSDTVQVTLPCQHRSHLTAMVLFQFCVLVTLAFSLAGKLESFKFFETFSGKSLSPGLPAPSE